MNARANSRLGVEQGGGIVKLLPSLVGRLGWVAHRMAGLSRRVVGRTAETDPTNIAVLCDGFLRYGSAQAAGLSHNGLNVTLYYIDRNDEFAGNQAEREIYLERAYAAGVELVPLPRRSLRRCLRHTLWLCRDLRGRKVAVAVIHAHIDPRYSVIGLALPVALVVHDPKVHTGDELSTFSLPVRLISRVAELTASCLIIHSNRLFDQMPPLLRHLPIGVVPHGAEMSAAPAGIPAKRQVLVFGRLFAYKGVDTVLKAFSSPGDDLSTITLVVAGRGPLAALARESPGVELREEYITDADLGALLDDTRLVILAYRDATQSGVGLQAVARGVPCIVSGEGALPELVEPVSSSLIVPADSPEHLRSAIAAHIDHNADLRRAVYDHAAQSFSWPVVAQRMCAELDRLGVTSSRVRDRPVSRARANAR